MKLVFYSLGLAGLLSVSGYSAAQDEAADENTLLNQEYAPLEKKAPVYPYISQFNGVEGYCIIEYTVTSKGTVEDAFPEECQPIGLFEGISVQAARNFRYQPRIVDGTAVDVPGVLNKFSFALSGGGKSQGWGDEPSNGALSKKLTPVVLIKRWKSRIGKSLRNTR